MDQATEDRVKVIIFEELKSLGDKYIDKTTCIQKHKAVGTLEDKVRSLDNRLWAILALGLFQLIGLVFMLVKNRAIPH